MLCFCSRVSCNKKIVDFNVLAVLLYILSTRVGDIHAHMFLIPVHSSFFIIHNFSLTMKDHKRVLFVVMFGDNGYKAQHTMPSGDLLQLTALASLGYGKPVGRSSYRETQ
jgi:hypothetical protein